MSIHYQVTGSGPPLLFPHGLGSSGRDWEIQTTCFSGTHTVMTIDLRGHGESEKPPGPYSIQAFSDDVVAVLMDAVPTERPEQLNKVLEDFLSDQPVLRIPAAIPLTVSSRARSRSGDSSP